MSACDIVVRHVRYRTGWRSSRFHVRSSLDSGWKIPICWSRPSSASNRRCEPYSFCGMSRASTTNRFPRCWEFRSARRRLGSAALERNSNDFSNVSRKVPEMDCEQVESLLGRFYDGEVNAAERDLIATHVERCQACASEVEALAQLDRSSRKLRCLEPPPDVWDRIAERLAANSPGQSKPQAVVGR